MTTVRNQTRSFRAPLRLIESEPAVPVMTHEQARELGERVRRISTADSFMLQIDHTAQSITRVANGKVLLSNDGEDINFGMLYGIGTWGSSVNTNQIDDDTLRGLVRASEALLRACPWVRESVAGESLGPQRIPEVDIWKPATVAAMTGAQSVRDTALPAILDVVNKSPFVGGGVLGFKARATFILHKDGLSAYYRETDAVCTVSARSADGRSSGWAGATSRDWSDLNVAHVAEQAVETARRAADPVAIEPGRRTVILSATAFAQLLNGINWCFDAKLTDRGLTALSNGWRGGSKLGTKVADERLKIWSDPFDRAGGYMPFWGDPEDSGQNDIVRGYPLGAITWIDRGILQNLAYGAGYGREVGKAFNRYPFSMNVAAVPGTTTMTVDEMIANCEEGIYVNRFGSVSGVDHRSGLLTGVTRDGCFLVKRGKLVRGVKNFRFLESPFFVMNSLLGIGTPERVVVDDTLRGFATFPMIVPPVMARDFNFSALSDAV